MAADMTVGDLKAYIETESNVSATSQIVVYRTQPLDDDSKPLSHYNIEEDDMLVVVERPSAVGSGSGSGGLPSGTASSSAASGNGDPLQKLYQDVERVRQQMLNDRVLREGVQQRYPQLLDVINDPEQFRDLMIKIEKDRVEEEEARRQEFKRLQDDPYNEEAQRRILELIQQEAVLENLNTALEHSPEVFGNVTMLFVNVLVNGQKVKAFVDSGAQATIMSPECVERCHLGHLIDRRFQGVAMGVGTAKILGRIHSAPMKVGDSFFPCSFTVMEGKSVELLLGLDMLKRHQASIDLKRNVLVFGDAEVPFLPESEIPQMFKGEEAEGQTLGGTSGIAGQAGTSRGSASSAAGAAGAAASARASSSAPNILANAQPSPTAPVASEETIQNLIALGFSRDEVVSALQQAGGNPELAAALLFQ